MIKWLTWIKSFAWKLIIFGGEPLTKEKFEENLDKHTKNGKRWSDIISIFNGWIFSSIATQYFWYHMMDAKSDNSYYFLGAFTVSGMIYIALTYTIFKMLIGYVEHVWISNTNKITRIIGGLMAWFILYSTMYGLNTLATDIMSTFPLLQHASTATPRPPSALAAPDARR